MTYGHVIGSPHLLARVRQVSDGQAPCIAELRGGPFVRIVPQPGTQLEVDDIVLIDDKGSSVEVVDTSLWEPVPAVASSGRSRTR